MRILRILLGWGVMLLICLPAYAQHRDDAHDFNEIVVSGAQQRTQAETAMPVNVLTGEKLRQNASKTLGETLKQEIGVSSASFGPGVGQPVIRGQTANRVRVLQDGVGTLDAAAVSPDHANTVEAMLAERIEVIRGPATLLYGNGAIGGVVNIIDNRIPEEMPETLTGAIEGRYNTVADERAVVFKLDGGGGSIAWHLDGLLRDSDDVEIPGNAIDIDAVESLELALEDHTDDHADDHADDHEHEEELENTDGFIANSDTETSSLTAGISWLAERGFLGVAINMLENEYGLPPGVHGHHEDEEEAEDEEAEVEENVRIDMEQTRVDVKGAVDLAGFLQRLNGRLTINDYEHKELEGAEVGTVFSNEAWEGRITAQHGDKPLSGVLGVQFGEQEFVAAGEEAFIEAVDNQSLGVFAVESWDNDRWLYEFGLRVETQSIEPKSGGCDIDDSTWSGSVSALWRYREDSNVLFALNRSERAPTIEELLSNIDTTRCQGPTDPEDLVVHAATNRFEIGDPELTIETSQNIEIGLRKHAGHIRAEVSVFYNQIADYIYLADTGMFEGTLVSEYLQQDASFTGLEAEVLIPFELSESSHLDFLLFGDMVRAELDDGSNVPRIPPMRIGAELSFSQRNWGLKLRTTVADDQTDVAANETPTEGYTRVDMYFDYHLQAGDNEVLLFVKGNNLSDEEIRNHASFIKNFAPEPGRGVEFGLRFVF